MLFKHNNEHIIWEKTQQNNDKQLLFKIAVISKLNVEFKYSSLNVGHLFFNTIHSHNMVILFLLNGLKSYTARIYFNKLLVKGFKDIITMLSVYILLQWKNKAFLKMINTFITQKLKWTINTFFYYSKFSYSNCKKKNSIKISEQYQNE